MAKLRILTGQLISRALEPWPGPNRASLNPFSMPIKHRKPAKAAFDATRSEIKHSDGTNEDEWGPGHPQDANSERPRAGTIDMRTPTHILSSLIKTVWYEACGGEKWGLLY